MQRTFDIKGTVIGEGRPVICVPIAETDAESIVKKASELAGKGIKMAEWRVDCFSQADDPEKVRDIAEKLGAIFLHTIFLFTFRTKRQGGMRDMEESKILYLNQIAAKTGKVDLIDLEFFEAAKPEKEIRRLQKMGVRVIASHHDFATTPDDHILQMLMEQIQKSGADIAKLAVMPENIDDVIRLLKLTNDTKRKYPDLPVVTMSMGAIGMISRAAGETFGSCITFGSAGTASAPGQIPYEKLGMILDVLHEGLKTEGIDK